MSGTASVQPPPGVKVQVFDIRTGRAISDDEPDRVDWQYQDGHNEEDQDAGERIEVYDEVIRREDLDL